MADYLNIAGRVRTTASDGVAMEAQEVKDLNLNKSQQEVNADVQTDLGDRYTKEETYSKEQLDDLITTPDVNRVYVIATNLTTDVTDLLPATGSSDTLYNVGNWDGTQYDTTVYSIYGWNGTTYVCLAVRSFIGEVYDISVNHPDGQGNPTPYADLAAALGTSGANVPVGIRRGGMSIKFIQGTVQSSDNKYVQCRLMSDEFTTDTTQWQCSTSEIKAGSKDLVESAGVLNEINSLFFEDIKDKKTTILNELYLTGLDVNTDYYLATNIYNGTKQLLIYNASSTLIAYGNVSNDTLIKINQQGTSGIEGYAIIRNTNIEIAQSVDKRAKINIANTSNINNSPTIKMKLENDTDVSYPVFNGADVHLKDSGLAGKFFGFPFIVPTYSQRNNIIVSTLKELYLIGLDKTKTYNIRYFINGSDKYIHIYEDTTTIVAMAHLNDISNGIVFAKEVNSSGIRGYLYYQGDVSQFANSNEYVMLATEYCSDIKYSPNIEKGTKFIDISALSTYNYILLGSIGELFIDEIDLTKDYYLTAAYDSNSGVQTFKIWDASSAGNEIMRGTRSSAEQKIVELFQMNNSHLYGCIMFNDILSTISFRVKLNKQVIGDINNSPNIRTFLSTNPISVGKVQGIYRFDSILRAVLYASKFWDKKILIAAGTYNLENEFTDYYGSDFFTNYSATPSIQGIHLKNRMHLLFSSKALVYFHYSGDNNNVKKHFSPFNADYQNPDCYGFTLENANIDAANCRYCVHDERNEMDEPYTNKYINCTMKIDNSNNPQGYPVCLGGGLGVNGYVVIEGCKFESASYNTKHMIVSYHNSRGENAKSKIEARNNYFVGLGTFKFSWYGTSTEITEILVTGNSFGSPMVVAAEGAATVENISVTEWNNEVRTA